MSMKVMIAAVLLGVSGVAGAQEFDTLSESKAADPGKAGIAVAAPAQSASQEVTARAAALKKVKALAEEYFMSKDADIRLDDNDGTGTDGVLLVRRPAGPASSFWEPVKKYPIDEVVDSPQAIKSAKEYVTKQVRADLGIKVRTTTEPVCGSDGLSYVVDIKIKGVKDTLKTYALTEEDFNGGYFAFMEGCAE
ncbi:MAG: hypothetical protein PHV33_05375 [Elusimicrobiales bacterium]|nr:hypothetical protein [Elusimicrobiales bacterium]